MKIEARLMRNGKEINPNDLGKILSDEIQNYVQNLVGNIPDVLLGMSAQGVHGGGQHKQEGAGQHKQEGAGAGGLGFDEVNRSKGKKKREDR